MREARTVRSRADYIASDGVLRCDTRNQVKTCSFWGVYIGAIGSCQEPIINTRGNAFNKAAC